MHLFKSVLSACLVGSLGVLVGCQTYDSTSVSSNDINQLSTVYTGVVLSAQEVTIRPDGSIIGAATGAVLGGLGGSEIGGGDKAQTAGGVAGAVLGGILGNQIGKGLNTKKGYSYVVKINETGETKEITQGSDVYLQPGTPISIIYRQSGVTLSPASYSTSQTTTAPVSSTYRDGAPNAPYQVGSYTPSTPATDKNCKVIYPDGRDGPCTGEFANLNY